MVLRWDMTGREYAPVGLLVLFKMVECEANNTDFVEILIVETLFCASCL